MKKLLILTSIAEGGFGLLLLAYPAIVVWLLLKAEIVGAGAITARLTGLALIALAVACWPEEGAVRPYYGMLTWSVLAMLGLIVLGIGGYAGILLWPAVVVHGVIAVLLVLTNRRAKV